MPTLQEIGRALRWFFVRSAARRQLDDEIDAHIEMATESYVAGGMSPHEARATALREFGGRVLARERVADVHATPLGVVVDGFVGDIRIAARSLRRSPGFSMVVITIFTVAIAANATAVGLVDRLLFRSPAGVTQADRIIRVYVPASRSSTHYQRGLSYLRYTEFEKGAEDVAELAMASAMPMVAGRGQDAQQVNAAIVSANYFSVLGVRPARGRFFSPDEATPGSGAEVIVLSHAFWMRAFGGMDSIVGRPLQLGAKVFTVIGVAQRGFGGIDLNPLDVWLPAAAVTAVYTWLNPNWPREHNFTWVEAFGRVRDGVSHDALEERLNIAYAASVERARATGASTGTDDGLPGTPRVVAAPIQLERGPSQTDVGRVALPLAAVSVFVLLIASVNVANLFLTRAINRRREMAVRLALGVSRARLTVQLMAECLILAAVSGMAASVMAGWGTTRALQLLIPGAGSMAAFDGRMFMFTMTLTFAAAALGGLLPVFQVTRGPLIDALRAGVRAGTYQRARLRTTLLVAQAALSAVLLVGAGLFVRSLHNAERASIGFDPKHLLTVGVSMRGERMNTTTLYRQFSERLRGIPGVTHVSAAQSMPFGSGYESDFTVPGVDSTRKRGSFFFSAVDPDYFAAMGTRIVRGRAFNASDAAGTPLVAIVSESMARALWPGEDALGKCIHVGGDSLPCSMVIGIAEDIHREGVIAEASRNYYVSTAQKHPNTDISTLVVRVSGAPEQMAAIVRRELQSLAPGAAYVNVRSMQERVDPSLRSWRLGATAFGALGVLALAIAAMGLYSVVSNVVAQRRHEFGVRLALGAHPAHIVRAALRGSVPSVAIGLLIGLIVSMFAVQSIGALLYKVSPRDPVVFAVVSVVLGIAAVAASLVPAARALRIDLVTALRAD